MQLRTRHGEESEDKEDVEMAAGEIKRYGYHQVMTAEMKMVISSNIGQYTNANDSDRREMSISIPTTRRAAINLAGPFVSLRS